MTSDSAILDVIDKAYAAATGETEWASFLDAASGLFGAVGVSFEIYDKTRDQPKLIELSDSLCTVNAEEYIRYYGKISPRVRHGLTVPTGGITYDYAILTEQEMDADEFYTHFHGEQGLRYFVAGHLLNDDSHFSVFAAQRSPGQGHVEEHEIGLMRLLLPHIRRAVDLKYRLDGHDQGARALPDILEGLRDAAILLDGTGRVLFANRLARELFAADDGIAVDGDDLKFADRRAAVRLARALGALMDADRRIADDANLDFLARRSDGNRPYLVAVRELQACRQLLDRTPGPAAAIVFIRDPNRVERLDTELLAQSYGLTVAEADVASSIYRGYSVEEIARQRGVLPTTVRSQLYSLMSKVAVNRQVDLVRLLGRYRRPFC